MNIFPISLFTFNPSGLLVCLHPQGHCWIKYNIEGYKKLTGASKIQLFSLERKKTLRFCAIWDNYNNNVKNMSNSVLVYAELD